MRRLASCILVFCLAAPVAAQQLAWNVEKQHFVRYKLTQLVAPKGQKLNSLGFNRWGALWYELNRTGDKFGEVTGRAHVPLATVLKLPGRVVQQREQYAIARTFKKLSYLGDIRVQGAGRHLGPAMFLDLPCRELQVGATYSPDETEKESRSYQLVSGRIQGRIFWHEKRGHILGGEIRSWWKLKHRKPPEKGKPETFVERYHFRFEMDLVLQLDDPRLTRLVNRSISSGVGWLKKKQEKDGSWGSYGDHHLGFNALVTLALLGSGVKPEEPVIVKAFAFLAKQPMKQTYDVALYLMALAARVSPTPEALRAMTLQQQRLALKEVPKKLSKADRRRVYQGVRFLLGQEDYKKNWGYPREGGTRGDYDNSNSQYGVLGLHAAQQCGVQLPPAIWTHIARFWLAEQDTTGPEVEVKKRISIRARSDHVYNVPAKARGWNYRRWYRGAGGSYGSMTCAGGSLAICRSHLWQAGLLNPKLKKRIGQAITDGWAWM